VAFICDTGPLLGALDAADPDHERCARLLTTSEEDLVDAGVAALAERLGGTKVAMLDQRHLRAVRPAHVEARVPAVCAWSAGGARPGSE
jgi:predicted nucleic acid-binding protein